MKIRGNTLLSERYAYETQMNGVILDGERFFKYVEYYKVQYERLFQEGGLVNNSQIVIPKTSTPLFSHLKQKPQSTKAMVLFLCHSLLWSCGIMINLAIMSLIRRLLG